MRRLLPLALALPALALTPAAASAAPVDVFAVKNLTNCLTAPGASVAVCAENFSHDVQYHVYTCYNATIRVINEGDARELAGCLAAERATAAKPRRTSSRRSSRSR